MKKLLAFYNVSQIYSYGMCKRKIRVDDAIKPG